MRWARLLRVQLVQVLDDAVGGGHEFVVAGARSQRAELHLCERIASVTALLYVGFRVWVLVSGALVTAVAAIFYWLCNSVHDCTAEQPACGLLHYS